MEWTEHESSPMPVGGLLQGTLSWSPGGLNEHSDFQIIEITDSADAGRQAVSPGRDGPLCNTRTHGAYVLLLHLCAVTDTT